MGISFDAVLAYWKKSQNQHYRMLMTNIVKMTEPKTYQASASSLIDLKAELYRKREAFNQEKLNRALGKPTLKNHGGKKGDIWANKNSGVAERNAKDIAQEAEKDAAVRKAKESLERKARLYEFLSKGNTVEGNENGQLFLVNFEKKVIDEALEKRACQSEECDVKDRTTPTYDHQSLEFVDPEGDDVNQEKEASFRNLKEQEGPVHYQNIHYNEIRQHGTGYFAFSQDEEERQRQMENLKHLTEQTNKQRIVQEKLKERRKAMLKARLNKVRQRKNIEVEEDISKNSDSDGLESGNEAKDQVSLDDIPLPESEPLPVEEAVTKKPHVRPWDHGKIMDPVHRPPPPKFKKVSQEAWIEERREERCNEFAPPSTYNEAHGHPQKQHYKGRHSKKWKTRDDMHNSHQQPFWSETSPTSVDSHESPSYPPQVACNNSSDGRSACLDPISEALAYFRNQSNTT